MKRNVWIYVLAVYVICYGLRLWEYFGIRTDQTIIGEAFIHKILGILLLVIVMRQLKYKWADIGIKKEGCIRFTGYGLLSGIGAFIIGYTIEIIFCITQNNFSGLRFYVSSYAVDTNIAMSQGWIFLLICLLGNVLNVMMEESVFRGLFQKMFMSRYSFVVSAVFCSVLFGLWHVIGPIRNYIDGTSSFGAAMANVMILFVSSGLIGFKFAMLSRLEGALYMGMADHFVNNVITNLLHVTNAGGDDEWMFMRIAAAQLVSFVVVLVVYIHSGACKRREIG